ncbi:sensitivity to high expression protein she9 [Coemansia furcata]|uniref:Sensitivity to high expression protein she9 n=1 Tax=Coemansia furcata TaxID=417177 RepID=A0ACC1LKI8_9FUNG|nr:sensitivity to high expression protein she9 [Coemansia furcata]
MLAPTGRCQSTALCALRLGYRHAVRIRRYASSGNNNSADPAEPEQHETPVHAKSVGVPPSHRRPAGATMALVPMNIIYLPPPKWHQPLRPLPTPGRPAPDMPTTGHDTNDTTAKTFVPESNVGDETSKVADSHDVHPTGVIRRLIARLLVRAEPLADKPLTETADKAQPAEAPATDGPVADGPSKAQQVSEAASAAAEAASERWRHAVGSARQKVDALRQLPQDDDWATWLGKALNQLTGYDRIAEHKQRVQDSGTAFHDARQHLTAIKTHHAQVIQSRMSGQREINSLLQRKHLWNDDDVARFTGLYRAEHQAEASEQSASQELRDTEALVDQKYDQLVAAIRDRYHEEQIWSDKIRRASTYGTWAVLFMNIIALFLAQAIFEPRKRRKIVAGVDERLAAAMGEQHARVADIGLSVEHRMAAHESSIAAIAAHLASVSTTLATVASRQETEMTVLGSQLLGPPAGNGSAVDVADLMKLGGDGYSDTELDMYYAQQHDSRRLLQRLIPGSMIWRAVKPSDATQATFSRAEAGQLALESAAVALAVGLAAAAVYFSA